MSDAVLPVEALPVPAASPNAGRSCTVEHVTPASRAQAAEGTPVDIVWWEVLDGRYRIEVARDAGQPGWLNISVDEHRAGAWRPVGDVVFVLSGPACGDDIEAGRWEALAEGLIVEVSAGRPGPRDGDDYRRPASARPRIRA